MNEFVEDPEYAGEDIDDEDYDVEDDFEPSPRKKIRPDFTPTLARAKATPAKIAVSNLFRSICFPKIFSAYISVVSQNLFSI